MWWPFQWLFIYVLGGFTCIPVMLGLAIWWVMTYGSIPIGDDDPMKRIKVRLQRQHDAGPGAATSDDATAADLNTRKFAGYLTVRRQFRPAASNTSFLFGASTDLSGAEVKEDDSDDSSSLKDGKTGNTAAPIAAPTVSQRLVGAYKQVRKTQAAPPKEMFYCVLKGSVLFLYDDDKQTDCVAAISIEKYNVGMEKPEWVNGRETSKSKPFDGKDGEIFGKKNACVMRLVEREKVDGEKKSLPVVAKGMSDGDATSSSSASIKEKEREHHEEMENAPWFFFSTRNIEMEDLYIALVQVSASHPTITDVFSFAGMKQLVNTIDTEPDPLSTRWLNAFVGRIFLSLNQTRQIENKIIDKIKLKLTKVQRPAWLGEIVINEVHVGKTPPIFFRPMLKDLTPTGGAAMEIGLKYRTDPLDEDSGVRFIASTQAIIPLGYKQVTVNIMVEARLKTLEGNVLLKIKEPPSNRIWWGFTSPPRLDVEIRPVVQDRKLNLSVVLNQLDSLLRRVIAESIVLPAMDDIAFFDTASLDIRGGIFSSASKYWSDPTKAATEEAVAEEAKANEEVIASPEDVTGGGLDGIRKRRPSKSRTLDATLDKDEPTIGIARVDTAPANLDAGVSTSVQKRTSGLDKWFSPVPSVTSLIGTPDSSTSSSSTTKAATPIIQPKPRTLSSAIPSSSTSTPTLITPSAPPSSSRDPSPSSKPQSPVSIPSTSSDRRTSIDTSSLASTTLGTSPVTNTDGTSPATSSAALFSAVKQFRAGDKKALQDITKTGMDGVKKGWMNFAAKRKVTPLGGAPASPEQQVEHRPSKPVPYRPMEEDAGTAYARAMGQGSSLDGGERKSVVDNGVGKSLKERLDAAAHAASLASASASGSVSHSASNSISTPVPMSINTNGRSRSGTDSSKHSTTTTSHTSKPSLLSSPSKISVPTLSATTPSIGDTQWTPVARPSATDITPADLSITSERRSMDEVVGRLSMDSIRSSGSTRQQQPVSVQPGMGRGMVVPRVPKRPGEVTGLGSSPGVGIVRTISDAGEEVLKDVVKDEKKGEGSKRNVDASGKGVSEGKTVPSVPLPSNSEGQGLSASRAAALQKSPISNGGTKGDLASAIESDQAVPPVSDTQAPSLPNRPSASNTLKPDQSEQPMKDPTKGDLASAIEADSAVPPVLPIRNGPRSTTTPSKDDSTNKPLTHPTSESSPPSKTAPTLPDRPKVEVHKETQTSVGTVEDGAKSGSVTPKSGAEEALRKISKT